MLEVELEGVPPRGPEDRRLQKAAWRLVRPVYRHAAATPADRREVMRAARRIAPGLVWTFPEGREHWWDVTW
jgi:hypothetical protein